MMFFYVKFFFKILDCWIRCVLLLWWCDWWCWWWCVVFFWLVCFWLGVYVGLCGSFVWCVVVWVNWCWDVFGGVIWICVVFVVVAWCFFFFLDRFCFWCWGCKVFCCYFCFVLRCGLFFLVVLGLGRLCWGWGCSCC